MKTSNSFKGNFVFSMVLAGIILEVFPLLLGRSVGKNKSRRGWARS